jgi:hypothetical protein
MAAPRRGEVWLVDFGTGMRMMQAAYDAAVKKQAPGIQLFTQARDRLIRFYGDGSVAIASYYRYTTVILLPNTPPDRKTVHTHTSNLAPGG